MFLQRVFLKPEATLRRGNVGICRVLFQMVTRYARGKRKERPQKKGENMQQVLILEWGIFDWEEGEGSLRNHYLLMVLDTPKQKRNA